MRWQVIAQAPPWGRCGVSRRLPEFCHFAQQQGNLLLLTGNDLIQLLEQVFAVSGLDFKICQALLGIVWIFHTASCQITCY